MSNLINKILSKGFRLKIIKLLSKDLSLLINADVVGCVTPKTSHFYFNSNIEGALPDIQLRNSSIIYDGKVGGGGASYAGDYCGPVSSKEFAKWCERW